jgi:hypothetical protein
MPCLLRDIPLIELPNQRKKGYEGVLAKGYLELGKAISVIENAKSRLQLKVLGCAFSQVAGEGK